MALDVRATVEPHYPIRRSQIIKTAKVTLEKIAPTSDTSVAIAIIGDRKMRVLNRDFRGQDKTTDVLAFPFDAQSQGSSGFVNPPNSEVLNLGDVIISYPQLLVRAAKEDMLVDEMLNLLVVHGILHLFGYDHEKPQETFAMEKLEETILKEISVPKII
ncbi:MAG TPA: rRNA maturation RNase YbeY [Candidatus Nanoarchaeia archaeon]|nr:endoribonuclease YbeY [uncultured archaeon]